MEAQIAAIADDVAYTNHDLDDGLRAGFLQLDELTTIPLAGDALAEVDRRYPGLERQRRVHETIRRLIDGMARDIIDSREAALAAWSRSRRRSPGRPTGLIVDVLAGGRCEAARLAAVLA